MISYINANAPADLDKRNAAEKAYRRADEAFQLLGEITPAPMPGEDSLSYRKRLARGLQKHTTDKQLRDIRIDSLDDPVLGVLEERLVSNVHTVAGDRALRDGVLREIRGVSSIGRRQSTFIGDSRACWAPFTLQPIKFRFDTSICSGANAPDRVFE
jgi:hypothetical protein